MWGFADWGSQEHQLCLVDAEGKDICQRRFSHTADDLAKLCAVLRQPRPGLPAVKAVGIERPDGPVVDAMLETAIAVYVINPRQIERFQVFVAPSGRKDDRLDAFVGAEALRLHPDRFVRLSTPEPWVIVMRDQLRLRDNLIQHWFLIITGQSITRLFTKEREIWMVASPMGRPISGGIR